MAMKRNHFNLLLAAITTVLLIIVVVSQEEEEAPAVPLTTLNVDDIDHIEIIHPDSKPIVLDKHSYGWAISAPAQVSADQLQVNALTELATRESSAQYPAAEMDLAALLLDPPEWTIKLNDTELHFGGKEPLQSRRYIKVGDTVFLTTDPPSTALDANYSDLVHALIIPDSEKEIEALQFANFGVSKDDDGNWLVTPESASKGSDATQTLIDHWNGARSLWRAMISEDDRPTKSVILTLGEKEVEFQIVATDPQLKLARPDIGVVYTLPPRYASDLFELKEPAVEETEDAGSLVDELLPEEVEASIGDQE